MRLYPLQSTLDSQKDLARPRGGSRGKSWSVYDDSGADWTINLVGKEGADKLVVVLVLVVVVVHSTQTTGLGLPQPGEAAPAFRLFE